MRNKLYNGLKKYMLAIVIALIIIVIGYIAILLFFRLNNIKITEFKNDYFNFSYDNSWKIQEQKENSILLANREATLDIEMVSLEDEYKYLDIKDLLDDILYNISQQNQNYNLLFKESESITKNAYEGYKMLYEDGESQSMVMICKKNDKLFIFNYEATNSYFDILLDSAQNIIYTFDSIDEQFELSYKLAVDTSEIEWNPNEEVSSQLSNIKNYSIANNNYLVNFSVPVNFELSKFDSTSAYFNYRGLSEGYITLNAYIYNRNIYEYLDKEGDLDNSYKYIREGIEYLNFKENLKQIKFENKVEYIYKNSYTYTSSYGNTDYETVYIVYELDTSHILIIKINASKTKIPEELVNSIKLNSSKNYSSYVENKAKDGYWICELKEFVGYSGAEIQTITLKIPQKYKELDKENNIYTSRYYGLNYDDEMEIYQYDIAYEVYSSLESKIDFLNSTYSSHSNKGTYKELTYKQTIELNGKSFDIYEAGYTDIGGALKERTSYFVNVKVLTYKLDSGKVLTIEIKGNNAEISEEILNDLTNFGVEIKNN